MSQTLDPAGVVWITGLAGAGKTTLARAVVNRLRMEGAPVVLLDGDAVRGLIEPPAGHTRPERLRVARLLGRLCRLVGEQGIPVVCSTISLLHECQEWNRRNIPGYFEAYIRVSVDVLAARDSRSIYREARAGLRRDVVGVDIPAEEPRRPDWVWDNDGAAEGPNARAADLIAAARRSGIPLHARGGAL